MTEKDFNLLKTRTVQPEEVPEDAIRLYPDNEIVNKYNQEKIENWKGEPFVSVAQDIVLGDISAKTKESLLQSLRKKNIRNARSIERNYF